MNIFKASLAFLVLEILRKLNLSSDSISFLHFRHSLYNFCGYFWSYIQNTNIAIVFAFLTVIVFSMALSSTLYKVIHHFTSVRKRCLPCWRATLWLLNLGRVISFRGILSISAVFFCFDLSVQRVILILKYFHFCHLCQIFLALQVVENFRQWNINPIETT